MVLLPPLDPVLFFFSRKEGLAPYSHLFVSASVFFSLERTQRRAGGSGSRRWRSRQFGGGVYELLLRSLNAGMFGSRRAERSGGEEEAVSSFTVQAEVWKRLPFPVCSPQPVPYNSALIE